MIGIINYGLGNIQALETVYKRLNIEATIITTSDQCDLVDRFILPGVGSFDYAMQKFRASHVFEAVELGVLHKKKKILGICVGMQMLAYSSEEGIESGLGWIPGKVAKLISNDPIRVKLPHMGWNNVSTKEGNALFNNIENGYFYFVHSYYYAPEDDSNIIGTTNYTKDFTCAINRENVYGVQFHPEKSHEAGMLLLKNFARL